MAADALPVVGADDGVVTEFIVRLLAGLDRTGGIVGEDWHSETIFDGDAELG